MISATTLLLVLQHFFYVGKHVLSLAPLFSTVQYFQVPIVLGLFHSLLLVYTGKHLYDKNMNND